MQPLNRFLHKVSREISQDRDCTVQRGILCATSRLTSLFVSTFSSACSTIQKLIPFFLISATGYSLDKNILPRATDRHLIYRNANRLASDSAIFSCPCFRSQHRRNFCYFSCSLLSCRLDKVNFGCIFISQRLRQPRLSIS